MSLCSTFRSEIFVHLKSHGLRYSHNFTPNMTEFAGSLAPLNVDQLYYFVQNLTNIQTEQMCCILEVVAIDG